MDFRPKSCHQRMSLRGRRRTKLRIYKHPIIASVFKFVHFLRESSKIRDISSILGGILSTVNGFPTKKQWATNQVARPVDKNKVHQHPIISPSPKFVRSRHKSAKIEDNSSILGDFLNTVKEARDFNTLPTTNEIARSKS